MSKGKFLIITANRFPTGDAGAVRLRAFASILNDLNYQPVVVCMGESTDFSKRIYENVEYYSLRYRSDHILFRMLGRVLYTANLKKTIKVFKSEIKGILIDSCNMSTLSFVKKTARKLGITPIYDSVEWYSECEFKNGARNISYRWNNALNTKLIDNQFKVIAISSFLEKHFSDRGIETIRIPVIMDIDSMPNLTQQKADNSKIKIVYAGSMGKKDHIQEMLDGLSLLSDEERSRILFCVIGITKEQYEAYHGKIPSEIEESVSFKGRITREEVLEHLASADFSFLLRPSQERYAKAGFPTKSVEALSSGVPMLCNYSSDLDRYLTDKENSIIISECSAEACADALKRALILSWDELCSLRVNARKTAEENFDWRLYQESLKQILN